MKSQSGFTLIETLVSLVVISLLGTMIMQVIGHFSLVQTRLLETGQFSLERSRVESWFRVSIQGSAPKIVDTDQDYEGTNEVFRFTSISPLADVSGVPRKVSWRINKEGATQTLVYSEGEIGQWKVLSELPGDSSALQYIDSLGETHDAWPIDAGNAVNLMAVRFMSGDVEQPGSIDWYVHLESRGLSWTVYED